MKILKRGLVQKRGEEETKSMPHALVTPTTILNTLFRTELFVHLMFGKSRNESESKLNPYNATVMAEILLIILFKPVDIRKDDRDQHPFLIFSFVAMFFIKISQI